MAEGTPIFPVSRIAELIGVDRKTVREQFAAACTAAPRPLLVNGQTAQGWAVADFPVRVKQQLEKAARDQGYDEVERFLTHARERWSPATPAGRLPQSSIETARTRCEVFATVLRRTCDLPVAEIVREALAAWTAQSRHLVTERTLRRWIERAMQRDGGFRDWSRWEIWLDEDLAPIAARPETNAAELFYFPQVGEALAAVAVPACPTEKERARIWFQAMKEIDLQETAGRDAAALQRALLITLTASGLPLAKTPSALRKAYLRKRETWIASGGRASALEDRRRDAAKERAFEIPSEDKLALLMLGRKHGGNLAPAFREAIRTRKLTEATLARFPELPADKSHVPHSIRRAIGPDLAQVMRHNRGPRAARLNGPWTDRDWSKVEAGDWWVGDDLTPPVYWWEETAKGPVLMRGQILMMADAKTDFVLGWVLLSSRTYNSRAIRSLITRCHDAHGLPREGFHFEYGIWEKSRILTGDKTDRHLVGIDETEEGLSEFECAFTHANTPGQKTIERVFGLLQDRMESFPGYCGRDERRDCPEKTKQQILDVEEGREHPSKFFLEKRVFMEEVARIVEDHSAERYSRSRKIPNQAPAEVYKARRTEDIMRLDDRSRYLLANHRVPVTIGRNGIRLRSSLGGGLYRNEHTGGRIGEKALAWIDVDAPEVITITTLDRREPHLVERAHEPRALGAEPWELRAAVESRRSHASYGEALFRIVDAGMRNFRSVVVDRAAEQLGKNMQAQKIAAEENRREVSNLSKKFDQVTQARGVAMPKPTNPARLRAMVDGLTNTDSDWQKVADEDVKL